MTYSVFVSHSCSNEDHAIVDAICADLKESDVESYVSDRHPEPGRTIEEKLKEAIAKSDALIVVWTKGGRDSQWVNQEVGIARGLGKLVIPFVEVGVQVAGVLAGIEFARLDRDNPRKTVAKLKEYLSHLTRKTLPEKVKDAAAETGRDLLIAIVAIVAIVVVAIIAVLALAKGKG
jgi:hypothetical protein